MAKSVKLKDDTYLDSSGIIHNNDNYRYTLKSFLKNKDYISIGAGYYSESYFLIATLPVDNTDNGATLRINGTIGYFQSKRKAIIDVLISNRDGIYAVGNYIGSKESFTSHCIVLYKQSNNTINVYLKRFSGYSGGVCLNIIGTNCWLKCSSTAVNPTGTLVKTIDNSNLMVEGLIYSTDEILIGERWGKPLYRREFQFTTTTATYTITSLDLGLTNYDITYIADGSFIKDGSMTTPVNHTRLHNSSIYNENYMWSRMNGSLLQYEVGGNSAGKKCYLVVEYTKVTD